MIRKFTALLAAALLLTGCGEPSGKKPYLARYGLRIVSLAPNTTEILYALGLSNQVVGVSRFCSYPPDVKNKPSVGGLYDPNWEMIVALQPDLVIGLKTQKEIEAQLKALGIPFLGVSHEHISEIMESILTIGKACGAEAAAQKLFQALENKVGQASSLSAQTKPSNRKQAGSLSYVKPKVLVCVGHDEQMTRMYVAAKNTFYDELINLAGGTNACEQTSIKYPEISPEGLHAMNPDVIIDLVPNTGSRLSLHPTDASKAWKPYQAVIITNDYAFIPGPRFVSLLSDLSESIRQNDLGAE